MYIIMWHPIGFLNRYINIHRYTGCLDQIVWFFEIKKVCTLNDFKIFSFMNYMSLLWFIKKMLLAAITASRQLLNLEQVFFPCAGVNRLNWSKKKINEIIIFFVWVSYACFYSHFKNDFSSLTYIVWENPFLVELLCHI